MRDQVTRLHETTGTVKSQFDKFRSLGIEAEADKTAISEVDGRSDEV
jgi:hypothetical protein